MFSRLFDRITHLAIRGYWVVILLALAVMGGGALAMTDLNLELLPPVEFPQTVVLAQWPDSPSADQFLQQVTAPLEERLSAVDGVVNVESTTSKGIAFIIVRNEFGLNQDKVVADIDQVVDAFAMPAGAERPQVLNFSLSDLPVVIASVSSSQLSLPELKVLSESELMSRLDAVPQVSQVTLGGGQLLPEQLAAETAGEAVAEAPTPTPEPTATPEPTPEPTTDPGALPEILVQGAKAAGLELSRAEELTPDLMRQLAALGPQAVQVLRLLTPDNLRLMPAESIALLPPAFVEELDPALRAELDALAAAFGGAGQLAAAEAAAQAAPALDLPQVPPEPLPPSWTAAAASLGQTISTTADISAQAMQGIVSFAPQLLADLQPEMWRALDPGAAALALPAMAGQMDPLLQQQVVAIGAAAAGQAPPPVELPEEVAAAAAAAGQVVTNTAQIPAEAIGPLANLAPELLQSLPPEVLLGLPAAALAQLPAAYVETMDAGMQQTLAIIAIRDAQFQLTQAAAAQPEEPAAGEMEPPVAPPAAADPGRLPDSVIQGAAAAGLQIEDAADITPQFMRLLAGLGPQGEQALGLLTPDNLRLLSPEVIALLPPAFVEGLEPGLRAELDELAAEFGGAGALAQAEAQAAAEAAAGAPELTGIWLEPDQQGNPSRFKTAADILNNPFVPGAAAFLNVFPSSPNVRDPAEWMRELTPDILRYLADNEEGFAATLSPTVLELLSPEGITFLLDSYPEAFDAELSDHLRAVAAGEATVFVPEATITRTNGDPSLILSAFKDGDANTVVVSHAVFDALDAFAAEHPEVSFELVFEQASFIENSISGVAREGLLGAGFAVVIILFFLSGHVRGRYRLSWRSTLVTGMSIPLSVFMAFLLVRWVPATLGVWANNWADSSGNGLVTFLARLFPTSVTLNIMTLSGLTVAVGRVVDDAIVVLENVYRHIQQGTELEQAIREGTREVSIAIFASTATTVAVFLPLGLIGGIIGSFFLPFGLMVAYALAASFLVAITAVPALARLLIRREHLPEERETAMQRWYTPILTWALDHRLLTLGLAGLLFLGSLGLLGTLPRSFIPNTGEPTIDVTVSLPGGTPILETNDEVARFEQAVIGLPGVETVQVEVGSGGGFRSFFGGGVTQNEASITLSVQDQDGISDLTNTVRTLAEESFGRDYVTVSSSGSFSFGGFSLILIGQSTDSLRGVVDQAKEALGSLDVDGNGRPDIVNISSSVDGTTADDEQTIIRVDGQPAISFTGELETENTLGVTNAARQKLEALPALPAGVTISEGFESQQQTQGFASMIKAIAYAVLIVYAIMAFTFRSLVHPFTILFSLPFALVGAAVALFLTGSVLGISAMIGLMMLVGVVVTNAIVLMELVQQLRHRGMSAREALIQGGRTRLRPIWMTALTAILALIPLAVSKESGAVIASELARAVIGGLFFSTALTLLVVPVVYSLLDGVSLRRKS